MMRPVIAFAALLALSVPCFAQFYPTNTIVNQGNFNVNRISNVSGPVWGGYPAYPGPVGYPGYPMPGSSNSIYNFGHGNVNSISNRAPWGGFGMPSQNTIYNMGNGNFNQIRNR